MRYDRLENNHEKIVQLASRARRIKYYLHMHVMPPAVNALARMRMCTRLDLCMVIQLLSMDLKVCFVNSTAFN